MKRLLLFVSLMLFVSLTTAFAQVPQKISYQGLLNTSLGTPVPDGNYNIQFDIYNLPTGGALRYTQTLTSVPVQKGTFSVLFGPMSNIFSESLYVQVTLLSGPGAPVTFSPRSELVSVPYAFRAMKTDTAEYARTSGGGGGGAYLPLAGGTMTGAITSTGNPAITMGKGNFGAANTNPGTQAFVAGESNQAIGGWSAVGGGLNNTASGVNATVAGGWANTAGGLIAVIGGGESNAAAGEHATIGGGALNQASGTFATVGGGKNNQANAANATVGGGFFNWGLGRYSTVPGGLVNFAGGDYSFAAGRRARANHDGAFVWADSTDADFASTGTNQFLIRAGGNVGINTSAPTQALEVAGTIYSNTGGFKFPDGTTQTTAASGGGSYLPLAGGTMTGAITNTGNPSITMGKGNFGSANINTGTEGFVAGSNNCARGDYSVVSGGGGDLWADSNSAIGHWSAIAGGRSNIASGTYSTVGGGWYNAASGDRATVGGGGANAASYMYATVSGGIGNSANEGSATVGGGGSNTASGQGSFVGGGSNNTASGRKATISGGDNNTASEWFATVSGGIYNRARGRNSVVSGGGGGNAADSNSAIGDYSSVPGGRANKAGGDYSFAAGRRAKANHDGTFVWADQTDADFASTATNQFLIRAGGNVGINTNAPTQALEVAGTIYSNTGGFKFPDGTTQTTSAAIPSGIIVMWSGLLSNIPAGWALCNGTSGTPDLRDKFIYGTSAGEDPGATGGSTSHTHSIDPPGASTTTSASTTSVSVSSPTSPVSSSLHTHGVDIASFASESTTTLPPYFKLAFIMKL